MKLDRYRPPEGAELDHAQQRRKACYARDHGICAECRADCLAEGLQWHADHVVPLSTDFSLLALWSLGNLQTLCERCHRTKSAKERAAARRSDCRTRVDCTVARTTLEHLEQMASEARLPLGRILDKLARELTRENE